MLNILNGQNPPLTTPLPPSPSIYIETLGTAESIARRNFMPTQPPDPTEFGQGGQTRHKQADKLSRGGQGGQGGQEK